MKMIFTTQSGRGALRIGVNPCGKCQHIGFARRFPSGGAKSGIGLLDIIIDPLRGTFAM